MTSQPSLSDLEPPPDPTFRSYATSGRQSRVFPLGRLELEASPLPLSARDRATWRVASLILCVAACRGRSATVEQLHVLSWTLRDPRNEAELTAKWFNGGSTPPLRAWDPYLGDSLSLATAQGLLAKAASGRVALSDAGETVVRLIRNAKDGVLANEQQTLVRLGSITETSMWRQLGQVVTTKNRRGKQDS